ncbi:MAG: hypothetical protein ABR517_14150 [Thermoanaerobaculia bacterium]
MEEPSEFIDEERDSLDDRSRCEPGWDPVRFDLEDEPAVRDEGGREREAKDRWDRRESG